MLIIYTNPKFITPAENGLLNLFSNCILFVTPLFYMGTLQSSSTEYFKLSAIEFRNFFTSSLLFPFTGFIITLIFFFAAGDYLKATYGFPSSFFVLIPLLTFLAYFNDHLITLFISTKDLKKFIVATLLKIGVEFGLSVVLVVFFYDALERETNWNGCLGSYSRNLWHPFFLDKWNYKGWVPNEIY